jgi:hypothetical protein
MDDTPDFWRWYYHLARKWEPPDIDVPKIIGFALIMATFGKKGREIRPSSATLAKRANVHPVTARRLRRECIDLGLFRKTGIGRNGIDVLEIAIPRDAGDHGNDCRCGAPACKRRYVRSRAAKMV